MKTGFDGKLPKILQVKSLELVKTSKSKSAKSFEAPALVLA